jgi:hypothetical protein
MSSLTVLGLDPLFVNSTLLPKAISQTVCALLLTAQGEETTLQFVPITLLYSYKCWMVTISLSTPYAAFNHSGRSLLRMLLSSITPAATTKDMGHGVVSC